MEGGEGQGDRRASEVTHKGGVLEPFRGEWGQLSTAALGECVGNKGGSEGESSDEGSHRSFFVRVLCERERVESGVRRAACRVGVYGYLGGDEGDGGRRRRWLGRKMKWCLAGVESPFIVGWSDQDQALARVWSVGLMGYIPQLGGHCQFSDRRELGSIVSPQLC